MVAILFNNCLYISYGDQESNIGNNELILSRDKRVVVISDVKGNLGDVSVIVQDPPGKDWLKDRWQAASDMGGTAIQGKHWIEMDFHRFVSSSKIVLDWEAAWSDHYFIMCRSSALEEWKMLYDRSEENGIRKQDDPGIFSSISFGQSPGVSFKLPLHVVHTLDLRRSEEIMFRYLRLEITKPAAGWGVSLWQMDVYGKEYAW